MLIILCWSLLAAIHAVPAIAVFRPKLLTKLYGVEAESTLFLLLHHRAALFLGVCVTCVGAIFELEVRQLASLVVGISMVSFLLFYLRRGKPPALRTIAIADGVGLPFLGIAAGYAFGILEFG
jgi:hypothetical protein